MKDIDIFENTITHEHARKEPTIHQQARTDLLNCYGKYMNKQMYAELWNYTLNVEEQQELVKVLLGLYREAHRHCLCINEYFDIDDLIQQIKSKESELKGSESE